MREVTETSKKAPEGFERSFRGVSRGFGEFPEDSNGARDVSENLGEFFFITFRCISGDSKGSRELSRKLIGNSCGSCGVSEEFQCIPVGFRRLPAGSKEAPGVCLDGFHAF